MNFVRICMMKNWSYLAKKYAGKWVALAEDEETVLESGRTLEEVRSHALKKGYNNPIFTRVPRKILTYVGGV